MATNLEEYITTTISAVSVATAFGYMVSSANMELLKLSTQMTGNVAALEEKQKAGPTKTQPGDNQILSAVIKNHIATHATQVNAERLSVEPIDISILEFNSSIESGH